MASRGRLLGVVAVPIKGALLIPFDDIAEILSWGPSLAELARRLDSRPDKLMALRSNSFVRGKPYSGAFLRSPVPPSHARVASRVVSVCPLLNSWDTNP